MWLRLLRTRYRTPAGPGQDRGVRSQADVGFQIARVSAAWTNCWARLYRAWYRHITLAMAALAHLAAVPAEEGRGCDVISLGVPEMRRLTGHIIVTPHCPSGEHRLHGSRHRRAGPA